MVRGGIECSGHDEVAADLALDGGLLRDRGHRARHRRRPRHGGGSRSACRRCGSTRSPWGRPPRSRRCAAPASPSRPRAARGACARVINKLITEEDLYGAVDAAVQPGLAPGQALLPHRAADRARRGRARHRRAGRALRRDRRAPPEVGHRGRLGRRLRPKAHTPFQWFGQDTAGSSSARSRCCGPRRAARGLDDPLARPRAPRSPRGWPAGATAAWARSSSACGGPAARSRSGPSASTSSLLESALAAEGLSSTRSCHRDRGATRRCRGTTSRPGCTATSSGGLAGRLAGVAVEDCRWTPCYDCGACTGFGLEHVVASRVPPAGGSQGTGPGPAGGTASRSAWSAVPPEGPRRLRLRFSKFGQGPLHQPPRRGPDVGAGAAAQRLPWPTRRASCPTPWSASGSPCPRAASRSGSTSTCAWSRPERGEIAGGRPARGPQRPPARGHRRPGGGARRGRGGFAPAGGRIVRLGAGGARRAR